MAILAIVFLLLKREVRLQQHHIITLLISAVAMLIYSPTSSNGLANILLLVAVVSIMLDNLPINKNHLYNIFTITCLAQALYGLGQYFSLLPSHSLFPITGTFDNPAGFGTCIALLYPAILYRSADTSLKRWSWKGVVAIISIVSVVLSQSRTAILAIGVITSIWLYRDTMILSRFKRMKIWIQLMIVAIVISICMLGLYLYKVDSANGRVLIWQVAAYLIEQAPLFGHGVGGLWANYMDAQAEYLSLNTDSEYVHLADNIKHVFNEYIHLLVDYGSVGLALVVSYLIYLYTVCRDKLPEYISPALYGLVSLGIISGFSYPFSYPFVWFILSIYLAMLCRGSIKRYIQTPRILNFVAAISIMCFILMPLGIHYRDQRTWYNIAHASIREGGMQGYAETYKDLYMRMSDDALFLYNYGAELNFADEYAASVEVLNNCATRFNDMDVQLLLADNYTKLEMWEQAESHLIRAHHMCPRRFVPLYNLLNLYKMVGDIDNARDIAEQIVAMPIKVPSTTIDFIRSEAQEYLTR